VALLAFLQAIWGQDKALVPWVLGGLTLFALGLVAAVIYQMLRSRASYANEHRLIKERELYRGLGKWALWASAAFFFFAVFILVGGAFRTL
jgi:hypothetical protein